MARDHLHDHVRVNLLVPHGDAFRIRRRKVVLGQNVLLAKNLTLFF